MNMEILGSLWVRLRDMERRVENSPVNTLFPGDIEVTWARLLSIMDEAAVAPGGRRDCFLVEPGRRQIAVQPARVLEAEVG